MIDPTLVTRCVEAVRAYESAVVPEQGSYQGKTAERILMDAGLSELEQVRHMEAALDEIRRQSIIPPRAGCCSWAS